MTVAAAPAPSRLLIPSLSAANFAIGMGAFVLIGVLSPIADAFAMTPGEAGFVITIYAIAYAIASPVLVATSGAVDRRLVLGAGLTLFGAAALAGAFAPTPEALMATRVAAALGASVVTPVAAGVAAAASAPERRGKALAGAFFGLTLSQVVGVPAGAWIGYTYGWENTMYLTAALSFAAALAVLAYVPRGLPFQVNSLATLGAALRQPRLVLAILFPALLLGAIYVVFTYITPLLEGAMGFGRDQISLFLLVSGVGAVFGNLTGGWLADRIGPYRTLFLVAGAQVFMLPIFSVLPVPAWALYAFTFVWSVVGWSFAASQQARLVALAPEKQGVLLALNAAAIYVGVSFGSTLGGAVIGVVGIDGLGLAAAAATLVSVGALMLSERAR